MGTSSLGQSDIIIVGGGVAGLTTACLMGQYGFDVVCIDRENPYKQAHEDFDRRAIAISYGSHQLLKACGVWDDMLRNGCPIKNIDILDGHSPVLLRFEDKDSPVEAFGWIVEMYHIRQALLKRIEELSNVNHITETEVTEFYADDKRAKVTLSDDTSYSACLLVGADGRQSSTRKWLGVSEHNWSYNQRAIVCAVQHENTHNNIAVEHFHSNGPFAVLPMLDEDNKHRSSIVWTEHCSDDESILNLSDQVFGVALNEYFPDRYGRVSLASKVFSYPLGLIHAHKYYGQRTVLVADAAHGIHPVAGQGINLGFRDIAALAELIVEARRNNKDIGDESILKNYQSMRHFDNTAMAATCDMLVRLFSHKSRTVGLIRKAGLRMVQKTPMARRLFSKQAMGTSGALPKLIRGEQL